MLGLLDPELPELLELDWLLLAPLILQLSETLSILSTIKTSPLWSLLVLDIPEFEADPPEEEEEELDVPPLPLCQLPRTFTSFPA